MTFQQIDKAEWNDVAYLLLSFSALPFIDMLTTLLILGVSAVLFVQGKIRSDIVALCSLLCLVVFGILSPDQALSGFSNSIVVMMVGLFVVGGAIFRTGLAKMMGGRIMKLAGKSELRLLVLTMLVTASIGAFVSNTGTVALMLPILVSLAADGGIQTSRLLMPMAFASSMGGMMTLIGTPPNLVIDNQLQAAGLEGLGFFSFTPIGIVCIVTGILVLIPLSKKFLSNHDDKSEHEAKGKSLNQLMDEYQIINNLYRLRVLKASDLTRLPLHELHIPDRFHVNIVEVRRKSSGRHSFLQTVSQSMAGSNTQVRLRDVIYVMGEFEDVARFAHECGAEMINRKTSEDTDNMLKSKLKFDEIGIAEMLLMRNSDLINMPVKSSGLRAKYGVNVLAIQRDNRYMFHNLKDEKLHYGDTLLIQGTWADIARLSEKTFEWVVVGRPLAEASKVALTHKAPLAAMIMILMIAAMVFNWVPAVAAVLIAAVLMVLCGCLRNVEEAYKTINWESIVLIAAMLPMSLALEKTGASEAISHGLVAGLGDYGPFALLAGVYFTASLLTMFISNTATAVLLAPIAMQSAMSMNISPYPLLLAVSVGTSMCFASPFSTPPNALVMPAGKYTFMDYVKVGMPLQIIMGLVMVVVIPLFFPFAKS